MKNKQILGANLPTYMGVQVSRALDGRATVTVYSSIHAKGRASTTLEGSNDPLNDPRLEQFMNEEFGLAREKNWVFKSWTDLNQDKFEV